MIARQLEPVLVLRSALLSAAMLVSATSLASAAVEISAKPTANMSCSRGVCRPTAKKAVLNVDDLAGMLASGDATVKSTRQNADIEIDAALSWTSTSRLTLDSHRSIEINKPVEVMGTGALTIATNDGGSGGDYQFFGRGHVKFSDLKSNLTINGQEFILVDSVKHLKRLLRNTDGTGLYFAQSRPWNMSHRVYTAPPVPGEYNGFFEGLGNEISHLTIHDGAQDESTALGLFEAFESLAIVRDVNLTDVDIVAGQQFSVGALAGGSAGTIVNSHVQGTVSAVSSNAEIGGLVGTSGGMIANCYAEVTIIGGVGAVSAGGLIGSNLQEEFGLPAVVENSYAKGSVTSGGSAVGGLIGESDGGMILNSYSTASATGAGSAPAGGLIGVLSIGATSNPTLTALYSTGAVSGGGLVGGLIGEDLVGSGTANSYWDMDTSGVSNPANGAGNVQNDSGITGLTTEQFKSGLPAGFDKKVWKEKAKLNTGYPYLTGNLPSN